MTLKQASALHWMSLILLLTAIWFMSATMVAFLGLGLSIVIMVPLSLVAGVQHARFWRVTFNDIIRRDMEDDNDDEVSK